MITVEDNLKEVLGNFKKAILSIHSKKKLTKFNEV